MSGNHYIIRGGVEGRERLRILSRVMRPTTLALFERIGIRPGMRCLDVGCGGGDVTLNLAHMVGSTGRVLGLDIDETKLELARSEAESVQLGNVEFRSSDIIECESQFDVAYARFLLTHLRDPENVLTKMRRALRPAGIVAVEDIDFRGHFCHPDCPALWRYVELYTQASRQSGGDPHIGPRLPGLLLDCGFEGVQMQVVQPAGIEGEVKQIGPITMENISDTVVALGLASRLEVEQIVVELHAFARNPQSLISLPRVVQAWGQAGRDPDLA